MSITAIRNAIFAHLVASGPYSASEISTCAYDVLEMNTACVVTFFPEGQTQIEPLTMGRSNVVEDHVHWRIGGTVWLRDTGDPTDVLSRQWTAYQDLLTTFRKDNSLGGTAQAAFLSSISTKSNGFWSAGGHVWKMVDWVLVAEEF